MTMHTLQAIPRTKPLLPSKREVAARVFRQWRVLCAMFLLVLTGFLLTGQFRKQYSTQMQILVRKERIDSVMTPGQNSTPDLQQTNVSDEELNSEVELLKGEDLLQQVVRTAGLVPPRKSDPITFARAVRVLEKKLDVAAVPKTDVIDVSYESTDPVKAQRVLAALGQLYLKKHLQLHGSDYEISFLNDQVKQHKSALEAAEAQLIAFTRRTGIVSATQERDQTIQQMKSLTQERMEADAALSEATARSARLHSEMTSTSPRIATVARQADNQQLLEQIKSTLLTLQLKRADLLAKYDPTYRLVKDADHEIAVVETMLKAQQAAPVSDVSSDVNPVSISLQNGLVQALADQSGFQAKAKDLEYSSLQLQRQAETLQAQDIDQERLLREVKTEEDQYQLYVDKREQARMAASLDRQGILNVLIATPPFLPVLPIHSTLFVLITALFVSTVLGIGSASVADMFDPTVRNSAELSEVLHVPLLEDFGREIYVERGAAWQ